MPFPITPSLTTIDYYTESDAYHYLVDNRPLQNLEQNDIILANAIGSISIPHQVNPIAGDNVTIAGTYPNITFSSPDVPTQFNPIAGSNITLAGVYPNITFSSPNVPAQFNPIAGNNITLTGTYPNITFNSPNIPAQFTPIAGSNVTLTGTYPNITFNSPTVPAQFSPIAGTNITLSGTYPNITFNGIAQFNPIAGTSISLTGTYPNITINNTGMHTSGLVIGKASGIGIKVDTTLPTFGWRDITADIIIKGTGANDPTFTVYTGITTIRAYSFSATVMQEVFLTFHVPHDYVPGTAIHLHAHWSNAAATPNTGNVVWGFDYTMARGFSQDPFAATTNILVIQASPATRYMHMIAETVSISMPTLEPDSLILVRGYRDASNVLDTCTDAVFLHTMGIHYQSSNLATKAKAPNFYV